MVDKAKFEEMFEMYTPNVGNRGRDLRPELFRDIADRKAETLQTYSPCEIAVRVSHLACPVVGKRLPHVEILHVTDGRSVAVRHGSMAVRLFRRLLDAGHVQHVDLVLAHLEWARGVMEYRPFLFGCVSQPSPLSASR